MVVVFLLSRLFDQITSYYAPTVRLKKNFFFHFFSLALIYINVFISFEKKFTKKINDVFVVVLLPEKRASSVGVSFIFLNAFMVIGFDFVWTIRRAVVSYLISHGRSLLTTIRDQIEGQFSFHIRC